VEGPEERALSVKKLFVKKLPVGGGAGGGSALRGVQLVKNPHRIRDSTQDLVVAC
jgi:hypothetical protein